MQMSEDYDRLLEQMTDEVFHTIFPNRVLLSRIHEVLATYVTGQDADMPDDELGIAGLLPRAGI